MAEKRRKPQGGFYRLLRNKLSLLGLGVIIIMALMVIIGPFISSFDPNKVALELSLRPPQKAYFLGTDHLGRDVFTRLLYGGRVSMTIGITAALGAAAVGIVLGCIGGFIGGKLDKVLLRVSEYFQIFPQMFVVLILITFMGQGMINLLIIFTVTGWMAFYRLVRAQFFSIREQNFVSALMALRIPRWSIMFRHMLPNTLGPLIIRITMSTAEYVLAESSLSFLGVGIPFTTPTWGNTINAAKDINIVVNAWWLWVPPGLTISLFVLAVNFFGDGLRDVLDPKMSKRG
jgi:peptide/nickel transport system permease protein